MRGQVSAWRGLFEELRAVDLFCFEELPEREALDAVRASAVPELVRLSGRVALSLAPARRHPEIGDLVIMGLCEIEGSRASLPEHPDLWSLLIALATLRRRSVKILVAAHDVAVEHDLSTPRLSEGVMLEESLRIRKLYGHLVTAIGTDQPQGVAEIRRRLRRFGVAIAVIAGDPMFRRLRIQDRRQLRALQDRILAWLRDPEPTTGRRLAQDAGGVALVLSQIERRQELVAYDRSRRAPVISLPEAHWPVVVGAA